jgi:hypothetical protein
MSPSWKLFGPLEAADGMLMFGVSTAMVISVIQLTFRTKFRDLPDLRRNGHICASSRNMSYGAFG